MSTILFDQIVYGPVHSRRLGLSLGINLFPADGKLCNFNCIYCELGYNEDHRTQSNLPTRSQVHDALQTKLMQLKAEGITPDVITFSGNGEPTIHPDFPGIIEDTLSIRNEIFPQTRVAVLSNSTTIEKIEVFRALLQVDEHIMKLDGTTDELIRQINDPNVPGFTYERLLKNLQKFNGNLTVQSIFLRGERDGQVIDNTTPENIDRWIEALQLICPSKVMIYTIARETPLHTLEKIGKAEMDAIANRVRSLGFEVSVSY